VIERIPDYAESRLEGLLGEEAWRELRHSQEEDARQKLIGKKSTNKLIRKALEQFCSEAGIDDASCGYDSREVVLAIT
jgi:hypothetical protein